MPRISCFNSDRGDIWHDWSSGKYASTDRVGFPIWHHTFNTAAMTSVHAEKCCHLMSEHKASDARLRRSVRQLLIYNTFVQAYADVDQSEELRFVCGSTTTKCAHLRAAVEQAWPNTPGTGRLSAFPHSRKGKASTQPVWRYLWN